MVERGAIWVRRNVYLDLFFIRDDVGDGFTVPIERVVARPRSVAALG